MSETPTPTPTTAPETTTTATTMTAWDALPAGQLSTLTLKQELAQLPAWAKVVAALLTTYVISVSIMRFSQCLNPWVAETDWKQWVWQYWRYHIPGAFPEGHPITDYTTGQPARIDFGFFEDVARIDRGWPAIACPTLLLHGRRDETVSIESSRELAKQSSQVRLIELDDGHELVASIPTLLAETEAFLRV